MDPSEGVALGLSSVAPAWHCAWRRQPAPPGAFTTANLEIDPVLADTMDEVIAEAATR